jgi:outer membrane protein
MYISVYICILCINIVFNYIKEGIRMTSTKKVFINLAMVSLLLSTTAYAESKIGFVNTEKILKESLPAQEAQKSLSKEFSRRESNLLDLAKDLKNKSDKLERDTNILSNSERSRLQLELTDTDAKFQRERRNLEEEVQIRRSQLLADILERANREVIRVAETDNIDIVFQDAVWFNPKIDITAKVLEALKSK